MQRATDAMHSPVQVDGNTRCAWGTPLSRDDCWVGAGSGADSLQSVIKTHPADESRRFWEFAAMRRCATQRVRMQSNIERESRPAP
jgi:hypothetical protein